MSWLGVFQHWFYTAFFVFMAWEFLKNPARFTSTCIYFVQTEADESTYDRIMRASVRRKHLEKISPSLGYYLGVLSIVLAVLCGVTWTQPALWFAILCLGIAVTSGGAYLQLRNSQRLRVAVLAVRRPQRALPTFWLVAAALTALIPLVDWPFQDLRFIALIVTAASLLMTLIAWRISLMRALLEGADVAAEQFVDERLRSARSTTAAVVAMGVPFVYMAQTSVLTHKSQHILLELVSFCAWSTLLLISLRLNRRGPAPADLAS